MGTQFTEYGRGMMQGRRDILREISEKLKEKGIKMGWFDDDELSHEEVAMKEITITYKGVADKIEYKMFEGEDVGCRWHEGCIEIFGDEEGLVIPIDRLIAVAYRYPEKALDNHKES